MACYKDLVEMMNSSTEQRERYFNAIMRDGLNTPDWYMDAYKQYISGVISFARFLSILDDHRLSRNEMEGL